MWALNQSDCCVGEVNTMLPEDGGRYLGEKKNSHLRGTTYWYKDDLEKYEKKR